MFTENTEAAVEEAANFEPGTRAMLISAIEKNKPGSQSEVEEIMETARAMDKSLKAKKLQDAIDAAPDLALEAQRVALYDLQADYDNLQKTPSWRMQPDGVREKMISLRKDIQAQQTRVYNLERKNNRAASGVDTHFEAARMEYTELADRLVNSTNVTEADRKALIAKRHALRDIEHHIQQGR